MEESRSKRGQLAVAACALLPLLALGYVAGYFASSRFLPANAHRPEMRCFNGEGTFLLFRPLWSVEEHFFPNRVIARTTAPE
jgi:hypothetical protein